MLGKWLGTGLWLLLYHYVQSADDSASEGPKCKTLYTFGYGYRQFFHLSPRSIHQTNGDLLFIKFMVKARSDAHILLSPTPSPEESDPVYEIVLGAGKNSFSDIRRRRRANTKSSAFTKDILSGTELKGFWVKMNQEGMIQVGNEGNDIPFMQWQDPEPMLIEYFSFCTWSGVAGKWLYDCVGSNDSESVTVHQPQLTAIDRLRQALLPNYDVYSQPVTNTSEPIEVEVAIQTNYIQFDTEKSVITVGCTFTLVWHDEKMVWDPENFNNLSTISLLHHEIWRPQLIHFNALGKGVGVLGQAGMQVSADGMVRWRPRSQLKSWCQMDLRRWPWDSQTCYLQLGSWSQPGVLQLILLENGTKVELQQTRSEWIVLKLEAESVFVKVPWLLDSTVFSSDDSDDVDAFSPAALTFKFTIKRVNTGYFYIFVIPLIVMMTMSLTCFWMDTLGQEKLGINCLLVLLLCGWLLKLQSILPLPADHTPYLLKAYSLVLVVEGCVTVITVFVINLVKISHLKPPPHLICKALSTRVLACLFCLPKPPLRSQDYGELGEHVQMVEADTDRSSLVIDCGNSAANLSWALVAAFCDRLAFYTALIAYTSVFIC